MIFKYDRNSLVHHFFLNNAIFLLLFIKFYRNHHFFKMNSLTLNKYWSLFFAMNISIFFMTGFATMGFDFFKRHNQNLNRLIDLYKEVKYKNL